jgi:hypothetical protein
MIQRPSWEGVPEGLWGAHGGSDPAGGVGGAHADRHRYVRALLGGLMIFACRGTARGVVTSQLASRVWGHRVGHLRTHASPALTAVQERVPMRCPSCDFDNPEGMTCCGECGGPLKQRCPQCGCENPPGVKFCGACGSYLTGHPRAPHPPRRRGSEIRRPPRPQPNPRARRQNAASSLFSFVTSSGRPPSQHNLTPKSCARWCGPLKPPVPR